MIRLIVFLGNYGKEYEKTRHNAAWQYLESLPFYNKLNFSSKFNGMIANVDYIEFLNYVESYNPDLINNKEKLLNSPKIPNKLFFLKPMTYMNLSGNSIIEVCNFYKIKADEILVIHDELELKPGLFGLKFSGGLAGHNGLRSTKSVLNTADFYRIRLGIGKPSNVNIADYVLSNFSYDESILMSLVYIRATELLCKVLVTVEPQNLVSKWSKINVEQ